MNIILLCTIITTCIVYIWDFVEFPLQITNIIISKITKGLIKYAELKKPFGCSLCMTTWITLAILAVFNWKLMPLCLAFGWSTKFMLYAMQLIDKILTKIFIKIEQKLN